jgi:predicted nucleic acid-binding protein
VILYLDSSAILSIHLQERGRHQTVRAVSAEARRLYASPIAYVEVRAGLARARFRENPPRLTANNYTRALTEYESDWLRYFQVALSAELVRHAGDLAENHRLRAYDAVHLAAALLTSQETDEDFLISIWDRDLAAAATAEGLSLAHEVTT